MRSRVEVSEMMQSASDVWAFLKTQGGLDTKTYDANLVEELRYRLSLPLTGDFEKLLKKKDISIENFVVAFFQVIQPYAGMMTDLLCMFEEAGAKQTNKNLAIRFEFDQHLPELSFDLSHFRDWTETWTRISGIYLANLWDFDTIWALNGVLRGRDVEIRDPNAQRWLYEYMELGVWPDFLPSAPRSGDSNLDEWLARAWSVWTKVVEESSRYGKDRNTLRKIAFEQPENSHSTDRLEEQWGNWSPRFLHGIDSDYWAGSFARGAYQKAETISALPPADRRKQANELWTRLEEIFSHVPEIHVDGETLVRQLEEFLKLPIWQRRHELYSAWIATQLIDALKDKSVRIHQMEGNLVFSFSGTHFATADAFDPRLHVWAELRSPLIDPIGKSRKRAIQPDYSLVSDPITNPEASILEVECKQYRRPSAKNFSTALTDYAKGRPNAHVVLVNYGPANESILEKVNPSVRHRTSLIGKMRPKSRLAQEQFRQLVHDAVSRRYGKVAAIGEERLNIDLSNIGRISLSWGELPCDLDLHLKISGDRRDYEIYYPRMGSTDEAPWAQLDEDVRHGHGPETIEVVQWMGGKYHFAVHNYSEDASLAGCGASVVFVCGQQQWQFQCPHEGTGNWWSIFVVDTKSGKIELIDRIVESPW